MATHYNKSLSIQFNLNGLSFCCVNGSDKSVEFLESLTFVDKLTPYTALNRLEIELERLDLKPYKFDHISVIYQNELFSLVPKILYDPNCNSDYLQFNTKILKTDFIAKDIIETHKLVNVYIPYVNINNYLLDIFGEFEYKHATTILVEAALGQFATNKDISILVHVNAKTFELVVIDNNKLQLCNVFEFRTPEDFIYYILFTFEQLNLSLETDRVHLAGRIEKEDKLYHILHTYIRHVNIIDFMPNYSTNKMLSKQDNYKHYLILNNGLL